MTAFRFLPPLTLACAAAIFLSAGPAGANTACDEARPGRVFSELEAIDVTGEARLRIALGKLSEQEGWSQGDWEKFTLGLSDNPKTEAMEARRDEIMTQIFAIIARPPLDCDRLDLLEAEVLQLEQRQWDNAVREVEKRLKPAGSAQPL